MDMRTVICIEMCIDMCTNMHARVHTCICHVYGMCIGMVRDLCIATCEGMQKNVCMDMSVLSSACNANGQADPLPDGQADQWCPPSEPPPLLLPIVPSTLRWDA